MPISNATVAVIQKAGSAVFDADIELKAALQAYSERVATAMGQDPFNVGNDALFENWKSLARFSQTVSQIELELKKVHSFITALVADEPHSVTPVLALTASPDLTPMDLVVKSKAPKAREKSARKQSTIILSGPESTAPVGTVLKGNAAALMQYFETFLNSDEFTAINQSAIALQIGIPLGSMTAAIKRLVEGGRIVAGPVGAFKLGRID